MLVEGFIRTGAVAPAQISVANRSPGKLIGLARSHPQVIIAPDNRAAAREADLVFLCMKPLEVRSTLLGLRTELDAADSHVVSIAACVTLEMLNGIRPGRYTKVIPSLASELGCGVSLVCHGPGVRSEEAAVVERLFASLGVVKRIAEADFEAAADLTSCAPGMLSALFRQFMEAGLRHSGLSREDAEEMVVRTVYGTAKLLLDGRMGFGALIDRVATKGGITEEGVKVLDAALPEVFDQVFAKTLAKHAHVKKSLTESFPGT
jgi:pyrroline-5-carboxylate reductase